MMKKGIFLLIAPLLVGVLLIPAFSQEDMEVVDNDGFAQNSVRRLSFDMMSTTKWLR